MQATKHQHHFEDLSPDDFERLVYWLVRRSGEFDEVQWYGGARDKGRDVVAYRHTEAKREKWYIQCKRYQSIGFPTLRDELDKLAEHAEKTPGFKPDVVVFATACPIPPQAKDQAEDLARELGLPEPYYWGRLELDERLKEQPEIEEEFFKVERGTGLPSPDAIARHRAALRDRLEAEARARWGGMSRYIQEEGATLPIHASPYQTGRLGPGQNLLDLLRDARRLLVLGEPGSGKTVSLERLAWELCEDPEPVVPVLVPLFQYEGAPLEKWVRAKLREIGHLNLADDEALLAFLGQQALARCFFLFDGLNEVPPACRDRLVGELARWISEHPRHPVVLTSRPQDELWRRLRSNVKQAVVVQPIADEDARTYLVAHLGERGDKLYARLDERLREMAHTPLILWLIKEAGEARESVPGNRGELYARFVSRMLRRDTDRHMDAGIPDRIKRRALTDLAYHLGQAQRLSCPRDEAVEVVAQQVGEKRAEEVVGASARHGLLAGDDPLWFAPHQTVQEHFAALALREVAEREWGLSGWARFRRTARRTLSRKEDGLAAMAADDWWAETFVQLAGLVDDADRLALEVARVNPWLAWWCIAEGRGVTEETEETVADRSIRLLESEQAADRRRAVAALARMHNERIVQPLLRAAADSDAEVAGLAAQALIEMGETVRAQALALAQRPEHSLHRSGLAYLEALLGQPMVWVPPGPLLMGSDKERDSHAQVGELPQHEVTLLGYWIGRYPVTVAQFRPFVEPRGRRLADSDSLKGPDDHPVVNVTWHDALAFCRWLSERAGLTVTLPSEAEWEKAARGTDGRIYPWGDKRPTPDLCNFGGDEGGKTPVGKYSSQGDSPYGCTDMAGNVWEWTRSLWGKDWQKPDFGYPYYPGDGREDIESGDRRVVRGGAFFSVAGDVRCACRVRYNPVYRGYDVGFRVVASPVHLRPLDSL